MQIGGGGGGGGCNGKEREGGDHKAASRQKKLKAKTFKWRSSNSNMKSKVEAGGSDEAHGDPVLCSVSTASFSSGLISWKRVSALGKVAEQCDAVDPPVPRKLRSAINKRDRRFVSASSRHVKKRRHLSAISAQISSVDQETSFKGSSLFTEEEEVIADVLLSLSSQIPSHSSELTADKAMADSSNANFASTSCLEGATNEGDEIVVLPSAANELADQTACLHKVVEQTNRVPHVNLVPGVTDQSSNINPPLSDNENLQDLSLATVVNLPSPSKGSSNNSTLKQQKVRFDDSQSYPAQKPEAPLWLVNSNKSDSAHHEKEKAKNGSAQEIVPLVQTARPHSPDGLPSSKSASHKNTISESSKFTAPENQDKSYLQHSLVKNVGSTKAWKRSITHVYVSHVIQMHMNKEKASQNQVKPEEEAPNVCSSRFPNGSAIPIQKNNSLSNDKFHAVHFPVQPSAGMRDMSAGRQKIASGNFLNLPASTAQPGTQQHLQYLHPQITSRGAMPMPYPSTHLPYSRGNLAPTAAALQQHMPQYMGNMGYAPRPALPTSSSAMMMKTLHQLTPTQQQQQQMWQYHVSQYQPRLDATAPAPAAWHHNMPSSLRPTMAMLPPPAMMPAQMELFCAPYQGGSRQPQQLRLI